MEVWFLLENRLQKAEMKKVGLAELRAKMEELGIQRAEVIAWPRAEREPIEFGVVEGSRR